MSVCNELVRQIQRDFSVILALLPYRFGAVFGCFLSFFQRFRLKKKLQLVTILWNTANLPANLMRGFISNFQKSPISLF